MMKIILDMLTGEKINEYKCPETDKAYVCDGEEEVFVRNGEHNAGTFGKRLKFAEGAPFGEVKLAYPHYFRRT